MDTLNKVSRSLDSFNAVAEIPTENRKVFEDIGSLSVMNDDQDTAAGNLDVRENDLCDIINRLAFANFHDVSVKCDIDMYEETENRCDLPCTSRKGNDSDPIYQSILVPEVQILTDSSVFISQSEIKSEPGLENSTFVSKSVDLLTVPRTRSAFECHSWRGLFRHPKLLPMFTKMKLHQEGRLKRKREVKRLRYNIINMDLPLAPSQVVQENEKYSGKKQVKEVAYFEHRKKRKQKSNFSCMERVKKYEKLQSCIERLKNRNIPSLATPNQMIS